MDTATERRIVAEILDKRDQGKELTDREQAILAPSEYGYAAGCRCKK